MPRWFVALMAVVLFCVLRIVAAYAGGFGRAELEAFSAGTGFTLPDWYSSVPWFITGLRGDGAVFIAQTIDPLGLGVSHSIADASYRFSRIGFALVAWLLAAGNPDWAPIGTFLAGLLGVVLLAALAAKLSHHGGRTWLLVANPAVIIGFLYGTAEPLGIAFLVFALTRRSILGSVAVGMTRPSFLTALADSRRLIAAAVLTAIALRVAAWYLFGASNDNFDVVTIPLLGYIRSSNASAWVLAGVAGAALLIGLRYRSWAWALTALLILSLGQPVLAESTNAWRASGALWVLFATSHSILPLAQASDEESQ